MSDPTKRILCVDDHEDTCDMMKVLLETADRAFRVDTCLDGRKALDMHRAGPFHLYVLDLWMPEIDGAELCRMIRDDGTKSPIIVFSGMVRPGDRDSALAAGADLFLVKPHDVVRIAQVARTLIYDGSSPAVLNKVR